MTPQQPILTNKVLIPTEQKMALNDDYKSVKRLNLCTYIAKVLLYKDYSKFNYIRFMLNSIM